MVPASTPGRRRERTTGRDVAEVAEGPRDEWPMVSPLHAGRIMLVIAGLGVVASLVGGIVAWRLVGDLDRGVGQSLELTADALVTVDDSFVIAEDALGILLVGVDDAERAVRSLSASLREGSAALESATQLTGGEVADALESVERTLPSMQTAAGAIDETLGALDGLPLGLNYSPERPLAETIGELRDELRELPDELREQAAQVERMSTELTAATTNTEATADSLAALHEQLLEAEALVADYALRTGEARALVDDQREALASNARQARAVVVLFAVVFALGQFVPYHVGSSLLERHRTAGPPAE